MNRVLLLDQEGVLQSLALQLRDFGVHGTTVRSAEAARAALGGPEPFNAVVAELHKFTSGEELQSAGHRRIAYVERASFAEAAIATS